MPKHREFVLESVRGDQIILDVEGEPPGWLIPTIHGLGEVLRLPANWNSYGAQPVSLSAAAAALRLLLGTMSDALPRPIIVPTGHGGMQLEWHARGVDVEIEFLPTGEYAVYLENAESGQTRETAFGRSLAPVREALAELAHRYR